MVMISEGKYLIDQRSFNHYGKSELCLSYFRTRFAILIVTLIVRYTHSLIDILHL